MVNKNTVIGYIRVSTTEQATEGVSIDAQKEKIEAYCKACDLELAGIEVDAGFSAGTLERPGFKSALDALKAGKAHALLITKLDRLTRSLRDWTMLIETLFVSGRHSLISVSDSIDTRTASGRLVLNILVSVAQWEREIIRERTKEALAYKRHQGERYSGRAPYGYQFGDDNRLIVNKTEQLALQVARRLRNTGMPLRKISKALAQRGHLSRKGKPFSASSLAKMTKENQYGGNTDRVAVG